MPHMPLRVLFVDDENVIRLTLPPILEEHGYVVDVAEAVPEALSKILSQTYDVLIADLNIGQPGDGFTIASAMRRTQPNCINYILTGYPAFETALRTIRQQVDDYLVKPAEIKTLISSLEDKLREGKPHRALGFQKLATLLRASVEEITVKAVGKMKVDPRLSRLRLADSKRATGIAEMIRSVAEGLESPAREITDTSMRAAREHGRIRRKQGYSIADLVEENRVLDDSIYEFVEENLLHVDVSRLIPDLRHVNNILELQLRHAVESHTANLKRAA
jgi:DNA-binding response OmpR family regulator